MKNANKDILDYNINIKGSKPKRHATINEPSQMRFVRKLSIPSSSVPNQPKPLTNKQPMATRGILRKNTNTIRENIPPHINLEEPSTPKNDLQESDFRLIKSNSADNLCNRSLQRHKKLKSKMNVQDIFNRNDDTLEKKDKGKEKEKGKDNVEQVKILKTSDITSSK